MNIGIGFRGVAPGAALVAMTVGMLGAQALPQRWREFASVPAWEGTLRLHGSSQGTAPVDWSPGTTEEWDEKQSVEIRFRLEQHPMAPGWGLFEGGMEGLVMIDQMHKIIGPVAGCVTTSTTRGSGAPQGENAKPLFRLQFEPSGNYTFTPVDQNVGVHYTRETQCAAAPESPSSYGTQYGWWPSNAPFRLALPESGLVLRGEGVYPNDINNHLRDTNVAQVEMRIEWELKPAGTPEPPDEVVVEIPGYADWRPEAGPGGARGNALELTARLQKKGGGSPSMKALLFEWELVQVSRVPGYLINMPVADPKQTPDLLFEAGAGRPLILAQPEALKATTPAGALTESVVTVASYDWGSFGAVQVTAVMPDGSRIRGYLLDDPAQTEIRIPKREAGDLIAEVWRKSSGVGGRSDSADDEAQPVGDGNAGDGLTLYEEYRGFMENGRRVEGNPNKKDYFIQNTVGGQYLAGILLFRRLSELEVHYEFAPGEWPESRVINANYSGAPHRVDQHGVVLRSFNPPAEEPYAYVDSPGPSTPRNIKSVFVPPIPAKAGPMQTAYMNHSLAHELFHACNVYHHGERDRKVIWRRVQDTETVLERNAGGKEEHEVRILDEQGLNLNPTIPVAGEGVLLGNPGGPHSGHELCVMRYDVAGGYKSLRDADARYVSAEGTGREICHVTEGTGVNEVARLPQSRFGDSAASRGNCAAQILVNDAVTPPVR